MQWITGTDNRIMIVLNKGDRIIDTLTQAITKHQIQGGFLVGIGALRDVEIGYFDLAKKTFMKQSFEGESYELLSFNGNVCLKDNQPFLHVHVLLGKHDFSTFGGHLFEGTVAVTAEILLLPLGTMPTRMMNAELGTATICG